MSGDGTTERLGRAIETAMYAPLGLGLYLKELAPGVVSMLVARGRAEVDRRQEKASMRVTTARSIGQIAVAFGVPELRRRAGAHADAARSAAEGVIDSLSKLTANEPAPTPAPPARPARPAAPSRPVVSTPPPAPPVASADARWVPVNGSAASAHSESSEHLPIPGYDALSASQVVERLAGLSSAELGSVRDYETAHRNRRTILGKIDQLTG